MRNEWLSKPRQSFQPTRCRRIQKKHQKAPPKEKIAMLFRIAPIRITTRESAMAMSIEIIHAPKDLQSYTMNRMYYSFPHDNKGVCFLP